MLLEQQGLGQDEERELEDITHDKELYEEQLIEELELFVLNEELGLLLLFEIELKQETF